HPHLAAARARTPVDPLQRVAGGPGTDVGELDPLALPSRDLVPGERLRLARLEDAAEDVLARVDAQLRPRRRRLLPDEQADRIAGAQVRRAEHVPTPAGGADRETELALLAARQPQRHRVRAVDELEPGRQPEVEVEPVGGRR